jgi:hypothetical protein
VTDQVADDVDFLAEPDPPAVDPDVAFAAVLHQWLHTHSAFYPRLREAAATWLAAKHL